MGGDKLTFFENEYLWWTKVSALGQWAAAIATFSAVALSLRFSRREHNPKIEVRVELEKEQDDYILVLKAVNDGKVPIALKKLFHLILPNKDSQTIDPRNYRHAPEVLSTGDYWEIVLDLDYLITRLKSKNIEKTNFSSCTIVFEDHIGRRYQSGKLPQLPTELLEIEE